MKELMLIQSELKVPKGQKNEFGNYKYRSCEDILEALKPILLKHKCSQVISDSIELIGERYYVKAIVVLKNEQGEIETASASAREALTKKGMDESQITGASSSYARKYALNGLYGIDDTKDADSTNTHGKEEAKAPVKAPVKKPEVENDKEKKMRIFVVEKLKEQIGIDLNVKLKDLTDIEKEAFKEAVVDATGHADIMTVKGDVLVNTYKAFGGK